MIFPKRIKSTSVTYKFTEEDKAGVSSGDMLLFSFVVRSPVSTPINISIDVGTEYNGKDTSSALTYYSAVQWSRIYLPIKCVKMTEVTLSTPGTVEISKAEFDNLGKATHDDLQLKSGMWMLDDFEYVNIASCTTGVGRSIDVVNGGSLLYSIGAGALTVTDSESGRILGRLSGLGTLRQIALSDDGKHAVVTARQDGVYIINVENPSDPMIVSTYNSIEMATGLYISGKYVFVCNRQYGVEVVDISDPKNPHHLINIHSGEVQSCVVYEGILYAGIWGKCGVYMYDLSSITDSSHPKPIGIITTNGKGDGLSVCRIGNRTYLFAATGQHTYGASIHAPLSDLCYGQGNGLDIYDVTDPENARWISTSKADGRYYYTNNDYWETKVSFDESSGKYYAYLVNTYNGIYVFDVTKPEAPVRVARFVVSLATNTSPALKHNSRAIITSWDQTKERLSPIGAVVTSNGKLCVAAAEYDLLILDHPLAFDEYLTGNSAASFDNLSENYYSLKKSPTEEPRFPLPDGSYSFLRTVGQILAITASDRYLYVAAGSEGVKILDKSTLEEVGNIPTVSVFGRVGFANDVKLFGDQLYVASDIAGLRIYDVKDPYASKPLFIRSYFESDSSIARQITVGPEGKLSVVQVGAYDIWVIDNQSGEKILTATAKGGNMYHRNLSPLIDDRYVCFFNHIGSEYWLDFGPADARLDVPVFVLSGTTEPAFFTGGISMYNGIAAFTHGGRNYALKISRSKAIYTDVFTADTGAEIPGIKTVGRPTVIGNYLFVSNRIDGIITVYDISDISSARVLCTMTLDGNPDVVCADGSTAYIPLGYQGLLVIDTKKAFK